MFYLTNFYFRLTKPLKLILKVASWLAEKALGGDLDAFESIVAVSEEQGQMEGFEGGGLCPAVLRERLNNIIKAWKNYIQLNGFKLAYCNVHRCDGGWLQELPGVFLA